MGETRTMRSIEREARLRYSLALTQTLEAMGMDKNAATISKDAKDYETWQRFQESKALLLAGGLDGETAEKLASLSSQSGGATRLQNPRSHDQSAN